MSKLADVLESFKGGSARTITATTTDLDGGVQVGSSTFTVSNWISPPTTVGTTVVLLVQDGNVTGLGQPTAEALASIAYVDGLFVPGHARGTLPALTIPDGGSETVLSPTLIASNGVTKVGSDLRLDRRGWWSVSCSVFFAGSMQPDKRAFLTIYGPATEDGSNIDEPYRSSIGVGENFGTANATTYSNGTNGTIRFQVWQNNGAANPTTGGSFWLKYLGDE